MYERRCLCACVVCNCVRCVSGGSAEGEGARERNGQGGWVFNIWAFDACVCASVRVSPLEGEGGQGGEAKLKESSIADVIFFSIHATAGSAK